MLLNVKNVKQKNFQLSEFCVVCLQYAEASYG